MEFFFRKLETMIEGNVIGRDGETHVFDGRVLRNWPDPDFVQKKILRDEPVCALTLISGLYSDAWELDGYEVTSEISDIDHQGTGLAEYEITGTHRGNREYILEILQGGRFEVATYRLSTDGGETWGGETMISGDGIIELGDGTQLEFTEDPGDPDNSFVAGDTYSWTTTSLMEQSFQTNTETPRIGIDVWSKEKGELFGFEGGFVGYMPQIRDLIARNRFVTDGSQIIRLGIIRGSQVFTSEEKERRTYRANLEVRFDGGLYMVEQIPLVGTLGEIEVISPEGWEE